MSQIRTKLTDLVANREKLNKEITETIVNMVRVIGDISSECLGYRIMDGDGNHLNINNIFHDHEKGVMLSLCHSDEQGPAGNTFEVSMSEVNVSDLLTVLHCIIEKMGESEIKERLEEYAEESNEDISKINSLFQ